jgi:hypothetical protein
MGHLSAADPEQLLFADFTTFNFSSEAREMHKQRVKLTIMVCWLTRG